MKHNLLLVDDDPAIRFGFSAYLTKEGYTVNEAGDMGEARKALLAQRYDAIIVDLNLPDGFALGWIAEVRDNHPHLAIVVITGAGDVPLAVEAMRNGADHFVCKPVGMEDLVVFLQKSIEVERLRRKDSTSKRLEKTAQPHFGTGRAMSAVLQLASVAAASGCPVAIQGETGTGKGVLAHWIHDQSALASSPFVEVDCSNLKGELLASELFGHARGAFTSASADRQGLVELADGGTLFMDEIGDMDLEVQAQLLKVVEEKQFRRLGETKLRRSNFRLMCASNRDLPEEARLGHFRKDLLYRIYVLPIHLPPLRERTDELPDLVHRLLETLGAGSKEVPRSVLQLLAAYAWPGNIRELRNILERALLLARGKQLGPEHLPSLGNGNGNSGLAPTTFTQDSGLVLPRSFQPPAVMPDFKSNGPALSVASTAEWILEALKKAPNGLTRSEISALFARHKSAEEIANALNLLMERALVGQDKAKTAGRPVERWFASESSTQAQ